MTIDMRESFLEIPHQTSITKDNASISIDFITFFKVVDPEASVVQVANFAESAHNIAATTLRSVVGDITLDDVLAQRDDINEVLRDKLDEVTERWGVKVTNVEIREIVPPPAVLEAMTRQMSAERTRRASVTEAEGAREAAILRAEGEKQASILEAEGERQANILRAEAEQRSAVLRADGFAAGSGGRVADRAGHRSQDDGLAVPRGSEGPGRLAEHEVRAPDGARAARAGHGRDGGRRLRRSGHRQRRRRGANGVVIRRTVRR